MTEPYDCPACDGFGYVLDGEEPQCVLCLGTGEVSELDFLESGTTLVWEAEDC